MMAAIFSAKTGVRTMVVEANDPALLERNISLLKEYSRFTKQALSKVR